MKKVIMQLCNMNEEQYSRLLFNSGMAFAEFYFGFDQEAIALITQGRAYWDWYKNQFKQHAEGFCQVHATSKASTSVMYKLLQAHFEPANIISFPGEQVINQAINVMMSEMWRERRNECDNVIK